jgi:hypothetical protein
MQLRQIMLGVVAIKMGVQALLMKRMLVNLGAEAIINMSQDIVADQLENDKYQVLRRCLIM